MSKNLNKILDVREVVIEVKYGDTTGNGHNDKISLIEIHENNKQHKFTGEIFIRVENGLTGHIDRIDLESHTGITYKLYLGNFTTNYKEDILVQGFNYILEDKNNNYIFSYIDRKYKEIFNGHKFLEEYIIEAVYKDNYIIEVYCKRLNMMYLITIKYYNKKWLSKIYDKFGILSINAKLINTDLNAVYPIGSTWGEEFGSQEELYIYQTLISHDKEKVIAIIQNRLKWKNGRFVVILQNIAVFGEDRYKIKTTGI
ncbi:hypothetical protein [Clostridium septicum]|uniref:Uncharacterized protein n=1 Tax=Clostridium septicum TaxID=1504 RepID=A0A9N7JP25_CLOSE|nr:hypothetical protein [Clostridium septicum]AYE35764.1 hypothetical protein CP523_15705 [Clostridium septicum]MDU1314987.1 hypothetical protein [Clostridium septicum]QAS61103.1 hypothetical protein EI377_10425 [Clostridium septicum]UEC19560.1 hypothetical protein LK444_08990 [Clostridium septicum]USS02382.1 hypothetical protein NH397_08195 [Clostridium septicum]